MNAPKIQAESLQDKAVGAVAAKPSSSTKPVAESPTKEVEKEKALAWYDLERRPEFLKSGTTLGNRLGGFVWLMLNIATLGILKIAHKTYEYSFEKEQKAIEMQKRNDAESAKAVQKAADEELKRTKKTVREPTPAEINETKCRRHNEREDSTRAHDKKITAELDKVTKEILRAEVVLTMQRNQKSMSEAEIDKEVNKVFLARKKILRDELDEAEKQIKQLDEEAKKAEKREKLDEDEIEERKQARKIEAEKIREKEVRQTTILTPIEFLKKQFLFDKNTEYAELERLKSELGLYIPEEKLKEIYSEVLSQLEESLSASGDHLGEEQGRSGRDGEQSEYFSSNPFSTNPFTSGSASEPRSCALQSSQSQPGFNKNQALYCSCPVA